MRPAVQPFTRLEVIDNNPLQCIVQAEGRRGSIKIVLRGKLPNDFKIFASDIYQDPTELNSSWIIDKPTKIVTFNPALSKAFQQNSRQRKVHNGDTKQLMFQNLFIKFESAEDFQFSVIVTFPDEEELIRRKKLAD